MTVAADWSELPKDILNLISKRIDNEIDLIRFRSICSSWRSSSIVNHHTNILPFKFPLLKYVLHSDTDSDDEFFDSDYDFSDYINEYEFSDSININDTNFPFSYLSKRSIFLIKPPQQQQQQQDQTLILRPWLVRITQNSTGKTKIFQPDTAFESIFPSFNRIGNLRDGKCVFHLDQDRLSHVSEYPEYLNLFLPPEWILKSSICNMMLKNDVEFEFTDKCSGGFFKSTS